MKKIGNQLLIGTFTGSIIVYDIKENSITKCLEKITKSGLYGIEAYIDEKFLTISSDNKLRIWKDLEIISEIDFKLKGK